MNNYDYEMGQMPEMTGTTKHVLTGIVVGGLIGATAMMLVAPRTGEEMRAEIKDKAVDLRDRTTESVKDTVSQVVSKAGHLPQNTNGLISHFFDIFEGNICNRERDQKQAQRPDNFVGSQGSKNGNEILGRLD